jgi:hypothetical protein
MPRVRRFVVFGFVGLMTTALVGCTTNSPGHVGYESRASTTAERMISPVSTGALLANLGGRGNLLGPYAKTATTNALDEADTIQSGWNQVQPPNDHSQRIGSELDKLLQRSTDELVNLRVAARKGDLEALQRFERPLNRLMAQLRRFEQRHAR